MRWPDIFFKAKSPARQTKPDPDSPPVDSAVSSDPIKPAPPMAAAKANSVSQAMEEADSLRVLTRSGGVRLIKRELEEVAPELTPPASQTEAPSPQPPEPVPQAIPEPKNEPAPPPPSSPTPEPAEMKTDQPASALAAAPAPTTQGPRRPQFRRKARLNDLARMILPAKREEPTATIVPPSFPVEVPAGTVLNAEDPKPVKEVVPAASNDSNAEQASGEIPASSPAPPDVALPEENVTSAPEKKHMPDETQGPVEPTAVTEPEKKPEPVLTEKVVAPEFKPSPISDTPAAEPSQPKSLSVPPATGEKREFFLANGERILGKVLSETTDSIYLEHATLGVLTLPRAQIAKRLVELILINGDRIVGDIVAETPDCLFVRHASLGMLTVPQSQRSTRVVEAILKDGDRIVGEVLAETDTYTVIRSATLGTVTVQHRQLAMLNRKVEQVALKSLPPTPPALEDKPPA